MQYLYKRQRETYVMCNMTVQIHLPVVSSMERAVWHFTCNLRLVVCVNVSPQVNSRLCPSPYQQTYRICVSKNDFFNPRKSIMDSSSSLVVYAKVTAGLDGRRCLQVGIKSFPPSPFRPRSMSFIIKDVPGVI